MRELRAFYVHLSVHVAVNTLLHVINLVTAPRRYLAHGAATYRWLPFTGKDWEERKIRELLDTDRASRGP